MLTKKNIIAYLFPILCILPAILLSQNKIPYGVISQGAAKQTNSDYMVWGNAGQINIEKSACPTNQFQGGFWSMFMSVSFSYPATIQLTANYTFENAEKTSSYKIIGLPGQNNLPLEDVLSGSAGKKGDWRAFWDPGSGSYREYDGSAAFSFTPGKAFWIVSKNEIHIHQTVNTVSLAGDYTHSIPLHAEWNLISNPFEIAVAWGDIQTINSVSDPIYYYQSGYVDPNPTVFEPYKGYYFFNRSGLNGLKIPYLPTTGALRQEYPSGTAKEIDIALMLEGAKKSRITMGFSDDAANGLDKLDIFSPPAIFSEISLALYNLNLPTHYKYLQKEYRPEIGEGQQYEIVVKNTSANTVSLLASGLENFSEYEICLLDRKMIKFYDLKDRNAIQINRSETQREYTLFIGKESYISQLKSGLIPMDYVLYQNHPNPFNPKTKIIFGLPRQSKVSLNIYTILGELVSELIPNEVLETGYHEMEFDGSNLSSGMYLYRLIADNYTLTKKMLLVK